MEKIFHLRGADLYRVEALRKLNPVRPCPAWRRAATSPSACAASVSSWPRPPICAPARSIHRGLQRDLRIGHAIVWLLDEQRQGLYTLASIGYEFGGDRRRAAAGRGRPGGRGGAREGAHPHRPHEPGLPYGMSWRSKAEQLGLQAAMAEHRPAAGPVAPAQPAGGAAARARPHRGRAAGRSDHDQFFSYDDEDALAADRRPAGARPGRAAHGRGGLAEGAPAATFGDSTPAGLAPLRIRHYARDHSVFVNDDYLIKGVAGAIVAKLVRDAAARARRLQHARAAPGRRRPAPARGAGQPGCTPADAGAPIGRARLRPAHRTLRTRPLQAARAAATGAGRSGGLRQLGLVPAAA